MNQSNEPLDLPHLVRVCERSIKAQFICDTMVDYHHDRVADLGRATLEFRSTFTESTVLALLRRLGEAEEKVKQLEHIAHCGSDVLRYEILIDNATTKEGKRQYRMNLNDAKANLNLALRKANCSVDVRTGKIRRPHDAE